MNRLQFLLTAKTQYDIQSPFLFRFYSEVLNTRIGKADCERLGIAFGDRYAQLRYKLCDHYKASPLIVDGWPADDLLSSTEVGIIGMVRSPHKDYGREAVWTSAVRRDDVTLSVDLYDVGLFFTCPKLSKQHIPLRIV